MRSDLQPFGEVKMGIMFCVVYRCYNEARYIFFGHSLCSHHYNMIRPSFISGARLEPWQVLAWAEEEPNEAGN